MQLSLHFCGHLVLALVCPFEARLDWCGELFLLGVYVQSELIDVEAQLAQSLLRLIQLLVQESFVLMCLV